MNPPTLSDRPAVADAASQLRRGARRGAAAARSSARWFTGVSRHGIIAAERIAHSPQNRRGARQVASQMMGSILIGLGVALFVHARLGVPAYDVMLTALRDRLGISLGQAGWLFTGLLYVVAMLFGQRPRLGGVTYMLANGVAIDAAVALIRDPDPLALRILFVGLGTASLATGVAVVIHAGLPGGAFELLLRAGEERGIDPYVLRRRLEAAVVLGGVLLGGDLGFATVFFVLAMSPLLRLGQQALEDHRRGREHRVELLNTDS